MSMQATVIKANCKNVEVRTWMRMDDTNKSQCKQIGIQVMMQGKQVMCGKQRF